MVRKAEMKYKKNQIKAIQVRQKRYLFSRTKQINNLTLSPGYFVLIHLHFVGTNEQVGYFFLSFFYINFRRPCTHYKLEDG